jgi:ribosomal protein L37AE/L43A
MFGASWVGSFGKFGVRKGADIAADRRRYTRVGTDETDHQLCQAHQLNIGRKQHQG